MCAIYAILVAVGSLGVLCLVIFRWKRREGFLILEPILLVIVSLAQFLNEGIEYILKPDNEHAN